MTPAAADDDNDGGDEALTAAEQATQLADTCLDELEAAENPIEENKVLKEFISEFVDLAITEDGAEWEAIKESVLNRVADKSETTRTRFKDWYQEEYEAANRERLKEEEIDDEEIGDFQDFLEARLDYVETEPITDHNADPQHYWHFLLDGDELVVTTEGKQHNSFPEFYHAVSEKLGVRYPSGDDVEGTAWSNFMARLMRDKEKRLSPREGPRTRAIRELEKRVSNMTAYPKLQDACENGGVAVDSEPPTHSKLRIPQATINEVLEFTDTNHKALQSELHARDRTLPGQRGASESTRIDGTWYSYWEVAADEFPEPAEYREEPVTPADRVDAATDAEELDAGAGAPTVPDGGNDLPSDASANGSQDVGPQGRYGVAPTQGDQAERASPPESPTNTNADRDEVASAEDTLAAEQGPSIGEDTPNEEEGDG